MVGTGGEVRGEVRVRNTGSRDISSGSDGVCYKERPGLAERSSGATGMRWKLVGVCRCWETLQRRGLVGDGGDSDRRARSGFLGRGPEAIWVRHARMGEGRSRFREDRDGESVTKVGGGC